MSIRCYKRFFLEKKSSPPPSRQQWVQTEIARREGFKTDHAKMLKVVARFFRLPILATLTTIRARNHSFWSPWALVTTFFVQLFESYPTYGSYQLSPFCSISIYIQRLLQFLAKRVPIRYKIISGRLCWRLRLRRKHRLPLLRVGRWESVPVSDRWCRGWGGSIDAPLHERGGALPAIRAGLLFRKGVLPYDRPPKTPAVRPNECIDVILSPFPFGLEVICRDN